MSEFDQTKKLQTEHVLLDAILPEPTTMAWAGAQIRAGNLVAFPTETVYGLGADALNESAVAKIFVAKERPASDPLIVHVAHVEQLKDLVQDVPRVAQRLIQEFWPGALTLVLPKKNIVPSNVTAGGNTVAVRMPNHAVALALIEAAGTPIAAPSANLFSRPSPTSAAAVLEDLDGRFAMLLDAGPTQIGVESTVLSLVGPAMLLRPGGVTLEEIEKIIGPVLLPQELEDDQIAPAPGMMLKHYAPSTRLEILYGPPEKVQAEIVRLVNSGQRIGVLLSESMLRQLKNKKLNADFFSLGPTDASAAAGLFKGLRVLDKLNLDLILAQGFATTGLGRALNDRLHRASQGRMREL